MQIFVKTLTGKDITLVVDRAEVGPLEKYSSMFTVKGFKQSPLGLGERLVFQVANAIEYREIP